MKCLFFWLLKYCFHAFLFFIVTNTSLTKHVYLNMRMSFNKFKFKFKIHSITIILPTMFKPYISPWSLQSHILFYSPRGFSLWLPMMEDYFYNTAKSRSFILNEKLLILPYLIQLCFFFFTVIDIYPSPFISTHPLFFITHNYSFYCEKRLCY